MPVQFRPSAPFHLIPKGRRCPLLESGTARLRTPCEVRAERPCLRRVLQQASEFRMAAQTADGQPVLGLFTRPDSARLMNVLKKYARGLHFWSTGAILPSDAPPSIERIFNMETRPADYWEPLLAAAA